jgi:phosphoserine phosphatase
MPGLGLEHRLQGEAIAALEHVRRLGLEVFIVSASPRPVVEKAAHLVGIDVDHVVAATASFEGGKMQASAERPIPYGAGKVSRLRERIGSRPLCAAFGDNVFDLALLGDAAVPVAIRPKPRLLAQAQRLPRLVQLAVG